MSGRVAHWLAWSLAAGCFVLLAVGWVFTLVVDNLTPVFDLVSSLPLVVMPVVGALIASRRPENAIGWLFLAAGLLLAVAGATYGYAAYGLQAQPDLPAATASAWLTAWIFLPAVFGVPPLLFLLFPDGRPLSRRWALVVALTVVFLSCQAAAAAFTPGPMEDAPVAGIDNPLGLDNESLLAAVELVGWTGGIAGVALAACSLVVRYRRSRADQRLQLRWLAFSALLFVLACLLSAALFQTRYITLGQTLILVAFNVIPVAVGIAILRHRLYSIDVVINRALVYGSLTATLAGVYLGSVLLLQLALNPLTEQSDLAVAVSTLAVAALFRPARTRIQAAVDRRFYRRRYDAARTLDAFAARLRHQVDLYAVGADLRGVVRETIQPVHQSLWLRS